MAPRGGAAVAEGSLAQVVSCMSMTPKLQEVVVMVEGIIG